MHDHSPESRGASLHPRWTPIRTGTLYCSPACGHGCTFAEYEKAWVDANSLSDSMKSGWEPFVWENMGWHFNVKKSDDGGVVATIEPMMDGGYWAHIDTPSSQVCGEGPTPMHALENAANAARRIKANMNCVLELCKLS